MKKWTYILQHKVFLLITLADTNSRQEPSHFPDERTKTDVHRRFAITTRLLRRKPPCEKDQPTPISLAQFKTALRTVSVKDPSHFCGELALWARTVRQVLNQRTPAFVGGTRSLDVVTI